MLCIRICVYIYIHIYIYIYVPWRLRSPGPFPALGVWAARVLASNVADQKPNEN